MAPEEDAEEVTLNEGMPVQSAGGEDLGTLDTVLVEEESEQAAFVLVKGTDDEVRLVPWDVLVDVEGETLILDVEPREFSELPPMNAERQPTEAEIALAYEVLGFVEDEEAAS